MWPFEELQFLALLYQRHFSALEVTTRGLYMFEVTLHDLEKLISEICELNMKKIWWIQERNH